MKYDIVIGLEIHSELLTKSKAFCSCKNEFGNDPNTNCCPVCIGLPGALPVLNAKAVEYTIKSGLAFNCSISKEAVYERKNYFYPDLSKAYQISQLEKPICINGSVTINDKKIRINRIHMEEDAGKNIHDEASGNSLVDYNRCGVPLIEIVTEPDISSSDEAVKFLEVVRETLIYIGVSDGKMNEGSLRCDVNVSLKQKGSNVLGKRTEMKNLNSFKAVKRAIDYEVERQSNELDLGNQIVQETRKWDDEKGYGFSLRTKEESNDYRYFPDQDLPPILISDDYVNEIKSTIPKLPNERREYYIKSLNLPEYDAKVLTDKREISDYFEKCISIYNDPKAISNFLMSNLLKIIKNEENESINFRVAEKDICDIIKMQAEGKISSSSAKIVFEKSWESEKKPMSIIEQMGLVQVSDESFIENLVKEIIKENPDAVNSYKNGNDKLLGFFVGQTMKLSKGKINPSVANKVIIRLLKSEGEEWLNQQ